MYNLNIARAIKKMSVNEMRDLMTVCYYHVMYEIQNESTLYSFSEYQGNSCSK